MVGALPRPGCGRPADPRVRISPRYRSPARASSSTPCRAQEAAWPGVDHGHGAVRTDTTSAGLRLPFAAFDVLVARGAPGGQAAVEQVDVREAGVPQHPPEPRGGHVAAVVVGHDDVAAADAPGARRRLELLQRRQRVAAAGRGPRGPPVRWRGPRRLRREGVPPGSVPGRADRRVPSARPAVRCAGRRSSRSFSEPRP